MLENPVFNAIVARRFGVAIDVGLGTLWWVRERQWKKVLPHRFASDHKVHPALSIFHRRDVPSPAERVPVLYGTSARKKPAFVVLGLSEGRGESHRRFFIHIESRPAGFAYATFDQEQLVDDESGLPPIWPNRHKSRVNEDEMAELGAFLQARGLK